MIAPLIHSFVPFVYRLANTQVGLVGFLVVIGLSGLSAKSLEPSKTVTFSSPTKPAKSAGGTPINKKTGSVMTPEGRRSARIARQRRKED